MKTIKKGLHGASRCVNPERSRRAFTLVEVLVATVILVIVIGGFASVETANIKTGTSSKYTIQANALDQQDMNIVKSIIDKAKLTGSVSNFVPGGECTDPGNSVVSSATHCPAGYYYIDNSTNKLMTCLVHHTDSHSNKEICDDANAQKQVDNKTFSRTVHLN